MHFKVLMKKEELRVLSITSGKGGVGKTLLALNFAQAFAKEGKKVIILDGNFGNGNVDVLTRVSSELSLKDVLSGESPMEDVIVRATPSISVIPAGTGQYNICYLDAGQKLSLLSELDNIDRMADVVIIDTPPGITPNVMFLNTGATEIVIVTTPEITSLMSTLSTIITLNKHYDEKEMSLVVNMAESDEDALTAFQMIEGETGRYLDVKLRYLGSIPFDMQVRNSVRQMSPLIGKHASSATRRSFREVARNLMDQIPDEKAKKGQQFFARRIINEEHERETYQNIRGHK